MLIKNLYRNLNSNDDSKMMRNQSDLLALLKECMPVSEQEESRNEIYAMLGNARGRYVPTNVQLDEDASFFNVDDSDSPDDEDDSIMGDLEELMEGNDLGDFALYRTNREDAAQMAESNDQDEWEAVELSLIQRFDSECVLACVE